MKLDLDSALDFIRQHPKLVVADDYELVGQQTQGRSVSFNNGEAIHYFEESLWWIQLRILHRKRVGISSTVYCEEQGLNTLVESAFQLADNMMVDPWFRFPLWRVDKSHSGNNLPEDFTIHSKDHDFFQSLFPRLTQQPIGLEEKYGERWESWKIFRKTEKQQRSFIKATQKVGFSLVNQGPEGFFKIEESKGFSVGSQSKERILDHLMLKAERLKYFRASGKSEPGKFILASVVVASILESIEKLFHGEIAGLGKSVYSTQIENKIASSVVSLVDDGTMKVGEGFHQYDLEGTPGQRTVMVKEGVLKTFLHDATSSARFNRTSSGNLILGEANVPSVGVTNFYLEPSEKPLRNLFKEMKDGVYIECLDKSSRDLTRNGKLRLVGHGWRVSNGEPVEPIGHIVIAIDPIEILKRITQVADDLEFWGRYGSPSVFIENMPLSEL